MERNMENSKKNSFFIWFILLLLLGFILITLTFFWMVGANSNAKNEYAQKNLKEVNLITEKSIEKISEIDSSTLQIAMEAETEESTTAPDDETVVKSKIKASEEQKSLLYEPQSQTIVVTKEQIVDAFIQSYNEIMNEQKQETLRMLDDLIAQGQAEWEVIKENGEDTPIVKGEKISEYLSMVSIMENNTDQSFETVLGKMKEQLEAEGIDAEPIIKQYREEYKQVKEENRKIMMEKAIKAFQGE